VASSIALVVIVASGQAQDATTLALADAAHTAAGAKVIVEEGAPIPDAEALAITARDHAEVVAVVSWDGDHSGVTVHLHRAGDARWLDRAVGFQSSDAPSERGRTIGFAIASMLPDPTADEPAHPPEKPPPPVVIGPTPPLTTVREHPHPEAPPIWHGAIDLSGVATMAVGGYGGGWGVRLGGQWFFLPRLSLRAAIGISARPLIPEAQASVQTLTGALGLGFALIEPASRRPVGLGGRVSIMAQHQTVSHLSVDDVNANTESRWLPAAEVLLEGAVYFITNVAVVLSGGTEIAMGETRIYVAHRPVATLAPWRFAGEIGFRARF
jgi:hypothetical protein